LKIRATEGFCFADGFSDCRSQTAIVKGVNLHNWNLVLGQKYNCKVVVFDSESHRFYTTDVRCSGG